MALTISQPPINIHQNINSFSNQKSVNSSDFQLREMDHLKMTYADNDMKIFIKNEEKGMKKVKSNF